MFTAPDEHMPYIIQLHIMSNNKKQKNETIGERDRGTSKPKITEKEREEKKKS